MKEMLLDTAQTAAHIPRIATCHLTGLARGHAIVFPHCHCYEDVTLRAIRQEMLR